MSFALRPRRHAQFAIDKSSALDNAAICGARAYLCTAALITEVSSQRNNSWRPGKWEVKNTCLGFHTLRPCDNASPRLTSRCYRVPLSGFAWLLIRRAKRLLRRHWTAPAAISSTLRQLPDPWSISGFAGSRFTRIIAESKVEDLVQPQHRRKTSICYVTCNLSLSLSISLPHTHTHTQLRNSLSLSLSLSLSPSVYVQTYIHLYIYNPRIPPTHPLSRGTTKKSLSPRDIRWKDHGSPT